MPPGRVFDTRFFVEYFYSGESEFLRKMKADLRSVGDRRVSVVTIHEIYRIDLEREGREVAKLRSETVCRDFDVVEMDYELAIRSAELRRRYRVPMADSVIAATAQLHGCPVVSDDPHFQSVEGLKTRWYPQP
ncbi:MAG: PIN domain-containing protein [Candidatus Bathyarchaeota archaeon]|jgi:predicted nucleic acid-binding protein